MTGPAAATLRNATFEDRDRVEVLLDEFGLGVADDPEGVQLWWDWMWRRNPALSTGRPQLAPGWLLEAEGELVGFFGNLPARYRLGDRTLQVAVASHWAVRKQFRSRTVDLSKAYFGQQDPDLLMVTTGIAATGRIFERFDARPMPDGAYKTVLYWILDPAGFACASLRKLRAPPSIARVGGLALAPGLATAIFAGRRRPGRPQTGSELETIRLAAVDEEFDELFERKIAEGPRLYACRGADDIRWHFELKRDDQVELLCYRREGRLDGYAVLLRERIAEVGLERLKIVDLLVAGDDVAVVKALLSAAYERGREIGCHVLELVGFPRVLRAESQRMRPFERQYPTFPFYYRAVREELDATLRDAEAWYPCLYDGDGCIGSLPARFEARP